MSVYGIKEKQYYNYTLYNEGSSKNTEKMFVSYLNKYEKIKYNSLSEPRFLEYLKNYYPVISNVIKENDVIKLIEKEEQYKSKINHNGYYL